MNKITTTALALSILALPAQAEILFTTGGLMQITPPAGLTVTSDWLTKNGLPQLVIFPELQGITLGSDLITDTGIIPAGTAVNSYLFGVNVYDCCENHPSITSVTFDGDVLGLVFSDNAWGVSSPNYLKTNFLGLSSLIYDLSCAYCGFEVLGNQQGGFHDSASFSGATATFLNSYSNPGDYGRVITAAAVPGPVAGAGLSALFLLGGLTMFLRRTL